MDEINETNRNINIAQMATQATSWCVNRTGLPESQRKEWVAWYDTIYGKVTDTMKGE